MVHSQLDGTCNGMASAREIAKEIGHGTPFSISLDEPVLSLPIPTALGRERARNLRLKGCVDEGAGLAGFGEARSPPSIRHVKDHRTIPPVTNDASPFFLHSAIKPVGKASPFL